MKKKGRGERQKERSREERQEGKRGAKERKTGEYNWRNGKSQEGEKKVHCYLSCEKVFLFTSQICLRNKMFYLIYLLILIFLNIKTFFLEKQAKSYHNMKC